MSTTRKIAGNFSWLLGGNVLSGSAKFIMMIYLARVLGASAFGLFQFAQAFLAYLLLLVDSGLSLLGTREIARHREQAGTIALNIFSLRLLLAFITFFLAAAILWLSPLSLELRWLFLATFLFIFHRALNADWLFQGLEKMSLIALMHVSFSFIAMLLVIFWVTGPARLITAPLILGLWGLIVSLAFLGYIFKSGLIARVKELSVRSWWHYFLDAWPLGASIVMIQIYNNLDTIMLGFIDRAAVVGYYNAAYQIFNVLIGVFIVWQATAIPHVSKLFTDDLKAAAQFLDKYLRLTLLIMIPTVVLVFLLSPLIIELIFGREYGPAVVALQLLVWTLISITIGSTHSVLMLIPAGKYHQFFISAAVGALVNIILNFILIPPFSLVGAAVATLLAEVSSAAVSIYLCRSLFTLRFIRHLLYPTSLAALATAGFLMVVRLVPSGVFHFDQITAAVTFGLIYAGACWLSEGDFIKQFIRSLLSHA